MTTEKGPLAGATVTTLFAQWETVFEQMESDEPIEAVGALAALAAEYMALEGAIAAPAAAERRETLMKLLVIARGGDVAAGSVAGALLASAIRDLEREAPPSAQVTLAA
jgi:hypothetical protein